jgi:transcriptional regulator with XRE-family HTH domain
MAAKRAGQAVGEQLKIAREALRLRQEDLVGRLEQIGARGWRQSKIAKIERGEVKRLTLDETLELAAALGVQPARLLANKDGLQVGDYVFGQEDVLDWITGRRPLSEDRWAWMALLWTKEEEAEGIAGFSPDNVGVPIFRGKKATDAS